jgi:hypothetical protein
VGQTCLSVRPIEVSTLTKSPVDYVALPRSRV